MSNKIVIPLRGEIWDVDLEPVVGAEMQKKRPAVVISSDVISSIPIKIVAPITRWKELFGNSIFFVRVEPDAQNNLQKTSAVNVLQVKALDYKRFVKLRGKVSAFTLEEVVTALAATVEYQ